MKVLVINQGDTNNYGDIAINETINKYFTNKGIMVDNLLYWDEEKVFGKHYYKYCKIFKNILWKKMFLVDLLNYIRIKKEVKKIKYDAVIIGGGELIGNHLGFNSSLYVITKFFYKSKIPIILYGVSGDINMNNQYLTRYKSSLEKIDYICVRDNKTKSNLKKGYGINADYAPDVVFARNTILNNKKSIVKEKRYVTLIPIEYYDAIKKGLNLNNRDEYIKYLSTIIKNNINKNDIIFLTTTTKEDNVIVRDLYYFLLEDKMIKNKIKFEEYSSLKFFESILEKSRLVISARMHGLILALNNNCEIISIPFKEKLKEFEKNYSSPTDAIGNSELVLSSLDKVIKVIKER